MTVKSGTNLSLKLFVVMMKASRSIAKRAEEDIRQYGLNPTEFAVLELLFHKGDQPIQKIGGKILMASSSLTYVVDKLEGKGLIVRKSCPKDRRVVFASITGAGTALIQKNFPSHEHMIEYLFSSLTTSEKTQMIDSLKKIGHQAAGSTFST